MNTTKDAVLTPHSTRSIDLVSTVNGVFGPFWIAWSADGITGLTPVSAERAIEGFIDNHQRPASIAVVMPDELRASIEGAIENGDSSMLSFDLGGLSDFKRSVLRACLTIPPGEVKPYGWLAAKIGRPKASRAVGTALAGNPIPLLIPCHRVVRSDGLIGNYAFGSEMKRELLIREGAVTPR